MADEPKIIQIKNEDPKIFKISETNAETAKMLESNQKFLQERIFSTERMNIALNEKLTEAIIAKAKFPEKIVEFKEPKLELPELTKFRIESERLVMLKELEVRKAEFATEHFLYAIMLVLLAVVLIGFTYHIDITAIVLGTR